MCLLFKFKLQDTHFIPEPETTVINGEESEGMVLPPLTGTYLKAEPTAYIIEAQEMLEFALLNKKRIEEQEQFKRCRRSK